MSSPPNKDTIDVDYLKVCPLILDWRSSLLGHKSNPGPHVLRLWRKQFVVPLDHKPLHDTQGKTSTFRLLIIKEQLTHPSNILPKKEK